MRYLRSVFALVLSAVLLLGSGAAWAAAPEEPGELTILFTHDTHDHFLPAANEEGGEYGGYIRLATLLKEQRQEAAEQGRAVVTSFRPSTPPMPRSSGPWERWSTM